MDTDLVLSSLCSFLDSTQQHQRDTESDVSWGYYSEVLSMTSTQSGVQAWRKHLASGRAHLKPHSRGLRAQPPRCQ